MIKNVIKRDKSIEPFDINKISTAVEKAYKSCKKNILLILMLNLKVM